MMVGQPVNLRLTADHNLPRHGEEIVRHAATIERIHDDGKWADVELKVPHKEGITRIVVPVSCIEE